MNTDATEELIQVIKEEPDRYLVNTGGLWGNIYRMRALRRDRRQTFIEVRDTDPETEIHLCEETACKIAKNRENLKHMQRVRMGRTTTPIMEYQVST